jgi:hypothetical protein
MVLDAIKGFATHYQHLLGNIDWKIAIHTPKGAECAQEKIDFTIEFENGGKIAVHAFIPERKNGLPEKYGSLLVYIPIDHYTPNLYMPAAFFDQWAEMKGWSIYEYFGKHNCANFEKAKTLSDDWTKMMEFAPKAPIVA